MFRDTTGPWPEDTDAGLLGAMRAASTWRTRTS